MRLFRRKKKEPSPFILADKWDEMEDVKWAHIQQRHIRENQEYYASLRQSTREELAMAQVRGIQQAPMTENSIRHSGQCSPYLVDQWRSAFLNPFAKP